LLERPGSLQSTFVVGALAAALTFMPAPTQAQDEERNQEQKPDGRALYEIGCASCHGSGGRGASAERIAFDDPLPDFTECSFASREPDADWIIVAKAGGPIRGFSQTMPAFGEAFDDVQLQAVMDHIRTFCQDRAWPRGELNLPRPLLSEKAYPEDEVVWTTGVNAESPGAVLNEFVYEKRFGARSQIEIQIPFGFAPAASNSAWGAALGDVAVAFKHAVAHNRNTILSLATEVKLPTGDVDRGFGVDAVRIEPFVALGQILPNDSFLHFQGGVEFSTKPDITNHEAFWRTTIGRTFTSGEFGRAWSPMLEVLGSVDFDRGSRVDWDLVPQMQVTLNTRQHVMLNFGVRFPVTNTRQRGTQFLAYILWDWFDGGFFDGW